MTLELPEGAGVWLAPPGGGDRLCDELRFKGAQLHWQQDRLVAAQQPTGSVWFSQLHWRSPEVLAFESIGEAAKALKSRQRNWAYWSLEQQRRGALIAEKLPRVSARPQRFGEAAPSAPMGAFTLLDRGRMLCSADCDSAYPLGRAHFAEDHDDPPSRAYLKLWEALTLAEARPGPGARCVELGAAPGGWTWVLATLGATVLSIDRASLAPQVAAMPRVSHRRGDAFALTPAQALDELGGVDWIVSDIIATPGRIFDAAAAWLEAFPAARLIFTIKLKGSPDFAEIARFVTLPDARITHLFHNRNELTLLRVPGE